LNRDEAIARAALEAIAEPSERLMELICEIMAMPSTSKAQARLMAAAAHDPKFAKKAGVPVTVAREFNAADAKSGILRSKRSGSARGGRPRKVK
jgi:hypothetical protein